MTNGRNWRIEDYITKHIQFFYVLADQAALGTHPGMFEMEIKLFIGANTSLDDGPDLFGRDVKIGRASLPKVISVET